MAKANNQQDREREGDDALSASVFLRIGSAGYILSLRFLTREASLERAASLGEPAIGMFVRMMLPNRYFSVSLSSRNKEASESNGEEKK